MHPLWNSVQEFTKEKKHWFYPRNTGPLIRLHFKLAHNMAHATCADLNQQLVRQVNKEKTVNQRHCKQCKLINTCFTLLVISEACLKRYWTVFTNSQMLWKDQIEAYNSISSLPAAVWFSADWDLTAYLPPLSPHTVRSISLAKCSTAIERRVLTEPIRPTKGRQQRTTSCIFFK